MAGESQQLPEGSPDPSVLTTEQLRREIAAMRDYVDGHVALHDQRFSDIDRATKLLNEQMTAVPTDVDKQVDHLKELHDEKFASIGERFTQRDVALTAALAAQEKQAAKQEQTFRESVEKQDRANADAIAKLEQLFNTSIKRLEDKSADNKDATAELRQLVNGGTQNRAGVDKAWGYLIGAVGLAATVIAIVIAIRPR